MRQQRDNPEHFDAAQHERDMERRFWESAKAAAVLAAPRHRRLGLIADDMETLSPWVRVRGTGSRQLPGPPLSPTALLVEALRKWEDLTTMDSTRIELERLLRAYERIEGPE